ncbi:PsbP-related protein [Nodosilinea sp. P-1105]|uniref:PsbP-related protein n=1 Tax=Nodosilinea sp. P-1105 TaxID=2546229 RepID=UPI00146F689D|nr:PsbP-related protein [Nodosilinea sp. P-1105]NMF84028.1 hypothetical protein [Nodosilinea sp. P-1105]
MYKLKSVAVALGLLSLVLGVAAPSGAQRSLAAADSPVGPDSAEIDKPAEIDEPLEIDEPAETDEPDEPAEMDNGPDPEIEAPSFPRRNTPALPPVELDSHSHNSLFSIGFPADWTVTEQDDAPQFSASAEAEVVDEATIRTEVTWHSASPREVVPQALDEIQANGYTVARYDAINIDGTTALRIWLTDLPDEDLPNALITYIGYADVTAAVVSYYPESTPEVDNLINGIHQSFQRQQATEP